ncbi:hypothetical protein KGQ71_00740 [Patescibacteria group bacterium]|nr:hypothetical protein [Patescibacteria group bacterium]
MTEPGFHQPLPIWLEQAGSAAGTTADSTPPTPIRRTKAQNLKNAELAGERGKMSLAELRDLEVQIDGFQREIMKGQYDFSQIISGFLTCTGRALPEDVIHTKDTHKREGLIREYLLDLYAAILYILELKPGLEYLEEEARYEVLLKEANLLNVILRMSKQQPAIKQLT